MKGPQTLSIRGEYIEPRSQERFDPLPPAATVTVLLHLIIIIMINIIIAGFYITHNIVLIISVG